MNPQMMISLFYVTMFVLNAKLCSIYGLGPRPLRAPCIAGCVGAFVTPLRRIETELNAADSSIKRSGAVS